MRTHTRGTLARFARSCAPHYLRSPSHIHTKTINQHNQDNQQAQPRQSTSATKTINKHNQDNQQEQPRQSTSTTKTINKHNQARGTLARFARSWASLRLRNSHHKTQPTPSTGDTRSLRSLVGYPAAPHSIRSPSRSRARSARLGFLLPTRGGNPRSPSAGLGKGLRYRQSTSLGSIPSDPPPCLRAPMRSRFARFVAALRSRRV